ncbi:hypothetical protein OSB04_012501 [Centaurea solstitialis]|uniref:CCHC-type domain-containing protein n=1 Tax=Centaurea solstitialis TaxID=347529 RepID=A0AA38WE15_9ASTR|nr:hypothetical protein OSB04_012501 [Centaurea solstitialis]
MASTVTSTNNLSLRSILEKDKLTGPNFLDWERNLMIVLRHERKWYVLEEPLGEAPPANAPAAARNAHKKHSDDLLDVACLMLATMSPDLQARLINTNAYDMIRQLRDMFQTRARTERYDATKAFNECKMIKGTSVSDHVMKMKRHLDHLERLGHPVPLQLATDTILNSLSEDYKPFVVNYNMNNMEKSIAELHSMLKTTELNMGTKNKTKDVLMVRGGGVKKKHGHTSTNKGKGPVQAIQSAPKVHNKGKGKGKGKKVKPNKARTENRCFTCNEVGHWRQNCPKRHEAGLAQRSPSISPTFSYYVDDKASVMECWGSLYDLEQCYDDFVKDTQRGQVGASFGPTCCKAARHMNNGCWSGLFPINQFFPQILEILCSTYPLAPPPPNSDTQAPSPQGSIAPIVQGPVSGDAPIHNGERPVADTPVVQTPGVPPSDADVLSPTGVDGLFADSLST